MIDVLYQIAVIIFVAIVLAYSVYYSFRFLLKVSNSKYLVAQEIINQLNILEQQLQLSKHEFDYKLKLNDLSITNIKTTLEELKETIEQIENYLEAQPDRPFAKRKPRNQIKYEE